MSVVIVSVVVIIITIIIVVVVAWRAQGDHLDRTAQSIGRPLAERIGIIGQPAVEQRVEVWAEDVATRSARQA